MACIDKDQNVLTVINVFTVALEQQQAVADVLVRATEETMAKLSGFVSASIHRSLDGTRVANYAQWWSRADFEAMLRNGEAVEHTQQAAQLATAEPYLYEVASVHEAP